MRKGTRPQLSSQWTFIGIAFFFFVGQLLMYNRYSSTWYELQACRAKYDRMSSVNGLDIIESECPRDMKLFAGGSNELQDTLVTPSDVAEEFSVVSTKTDPPFLIAIWPPEYDSFISKQLRINGIYGDSSLMEEMLKTAAGRSPSPLFVDLGANLGVHSLQAAAMGYKVIAFEPNPKNVARMKMSTKLNCFMDRLKIVEAAVSNKRGKAKLSVTHNSPGLASLSHSSKLGNVLGALNQEMGGKGFEYEVDVVVVDDYVKERVFLMKVDVEGFELFALKGAKELLSNHRVEFLHVEIFPEMLKGADTNPLELLGYLDGLKYDAYFGGKILPPRDFPDFIASCGLAHKDLIFQPRKG